MFQWVKPSKVSLHQGRLYNSEITTWFLTDGEANLENTHGLIVKETIDPEDPMNDVVFLNGEPYTFGKPHIQLYRKFAKLPFLNPPFTKREMDHYLDFASTYGLLAGDIKTGAYLDLVDTDYLHYGHGCVRAEPLIKWMSEAAEMRAAILLFKALQNRDIVFLRDRISWEEPMHRGLGDLWGNYARRKDTQIARLSQSDHERWEPGHRGAYIYNEPYISGEPSDKDFFNAGEKHLHLWITQGMELRTRTTLEPNNSGGLILGSRANCLIGHLWLQFARDVTQDNRTRFCPACSKDIPISNRASSREDKRYCSSACRQRAYRQRKRNPQEA